MTNANQFPDQPPEPGINPDIVLAGEPDITGLRAEPAVEQTERRQSLPDEFLQTYLADAIAGDQRATELLIGEVYQRALRFCRPRIKHNTAYDPEDAAQEIVTAVFTNLAGYKPRPDASFWAYVTAIASHKVTDTHRATRRRPSVSFDETTDLPDTPDTAPTPEESASRHERAEELQRLMGKAALTPQQQEILFLRNGVGLSAQETARIVGSTTNAVRVAQHRAATKLRGAYPGSYFDHNTDTDA